MDRTLFPVPGTPDKQTNQKTNKHKNTKLYFAPNP